MKWCFVIALLCASDLPRCGVKEVEHVYACVCEVGWLCGNGIVMVRGDIV